jgi:hypothetical protein
MQVMRCLDRTRKPAATASTLPSGPFAGRKSGNPPKRFAPSCPEPIRNHAEGRQRLSWIPSPYGRVQGKFRMNSQRQRAKLTRVRELSQAFFCALSPRCVILPPGPSGLADIDEINLSSERGNNLAIPDRQLHAGSSGTDLATLAGCGPSHHVVDCEAKPRPTRGQCHVKVLWGWLKVRLMFASGEALVEI